ncbi:MAG: hypothetical protein Q8922_04635 [Bacteroidota bacterium]|nr:hypothetical protein [Bacteroidota bacterium]MDP4231868.1 hypothetical protein [Bacteroidota bacterium]MDP4242754.1 hypothetical protein [Bacteroidota bacterium]MDP4287205.1 hypothetical protein [Bacteroidota bacterium]
MSPIIGFFESAGRLVASTWTNDDKRAFYDATLMTMPLDESRTTATTPMRVPPSITRRSSILVALVGLIIAAIWVPARMHFPFDDTYITFRYAANIAHGFGIVWNPGGPHTEGYTNFLFVLLLAPFSAIGADLLIISQALCVIAVIITAIALSRLKVAGFVRRIGPSGPTGLSAQWIGLFAATLFLLDPLTWINAYSGMETSLFTMWIVLAITTCDRPRLPYIFATFATLTRPEGAILGAILFAINYWHGRTDYETRLSRLFAPAVFYFVLPLLFYAAWKLWYFGDLLPNSFYVKVSQANPNHTWSPGRRMVFAYYLRSWYLALPAFYVLWISLRAMLRERFSFVALAQYRVLLVAGLWVVLMSGFYVFSQVMMPNYYRFFNSIEAMLIVLSAAASSIVLARQNKPGVRRWLVPSALGAFVLLHIAWSLTVRGGWMWINWDTSYEQHAMRVVPILESIPNHEAISLATGDAGILPYYANFQHIDFVGLNTTAIARARTTNDVLRYLDSARPDVLFIPVELARPADPLHGHDTCRQIIRWGHGLIGQGGYPRLAQQALASGYRPVATISEVVYDFNVLVDTSSHHYRDITSAFTRNIGINPLIGHPVECMW